MQTLNDELLNSLGTYFCTLSRLGYMKDSEVEKLIVALFIGEILDGSLEMLISEEDFKSITNALNCLQGHSCLLSYPDTNRAYNRPLPSLLYPRITEQCVLRSTEFDALRDIE